MSVVINDSCLESLSDISVQNEDWIVQQAIVLLERRVFKAGPRLERPAAVRDYLRLKLVAEPNEIFVVVFMNSMHDVLAVEPMFHGTINATSVYPRVVLQRALQLNAAAVIFAHQHPSGTTEPSNADRLLTEQLKTALALIDVRVLDHFVIGQGTPYSFAESGLCRKARGSLITAGASASAFSMRQHRTGMRGARDAHCLLGRQRVRVRLWL